ncbi:unnamed protein product [Orchesella dallaii]|uniref:BTB domain-containing protein n=1 Tax=Orchesella dallaii TaxID=48710 RepID=A0ABP1QPA0_9HEXA
MAVYLVNDKVFEANFNAITTTKSVSIVDFDVNLAPAAAKCEESEKFYSDLKSFIDLNGLSSSGNQISVTFMVSRCSDGDDTLIIHDDSRTKNISFAVKAHEKPLAMKVKVGGPFFDKVLKGFREKTKIKLDFEKSGEKFKVVSKELDIPFDNPTEGDYSYTFEDDLGIFSWPHFYLLTAYSSGTMTIKLLKCNTPTFRDATAITEKILHDRIHCDFVLQAKNGASVPCHMSFLACHSQVFERMFQTDCKEVQEKSCPTSLSEAGVNALLKFLYYSDLDDATKSSSISLELLKTAHEYDMALLEIAMKRMLLGKSNDWFDWDVVLLLFQFALKVEDYQDLKGKAVEVIKSKPGPLRTSVAFKQFFKSDLETAMELFLLVLNK